MSEADALDWLAGLFDEPSGSLSPDSVRDDIVGWDSVGMLSLIASTEEKFGVLFSGDEINRMTKVGDVIEILRTHGKVV